MKSLNENEQGFGLVETIALLLMVVLICISGWLTYKYDHKKNVTTTNNSANNNLSIIVGPVLGTKWNKSPDIKGYGTVLPKEVFNGGDPTGLVQNISWQSWGGLTAIGKGTSSYLPQNASGTADAQPAQATIEAFDLGTCNGKSSYNAVEWFFPEYGQLFTQTKYLNDCSGQQVGQ